MHSKANDTGRCARAIYRVCEIPGAAAPYDRAHLKIFYPAMPDDGIEQRNAGLMGVDKSGAPYPLLIMMPGINVGPEAYAWLGRELAMRGIVTVTYSLIAEEMPGYVSLTPGLDLTSITPETYGTRPSGTAVGAIIDALETEAASGILHNCVKTEETILAGHSAGGSVALYNANSHWFPQVKGAIAYGAHAAASTALGFAENTVLELPDSVPLMLIGGTHDGVIASSAHRYGTQDGEMPDRMQETFDTGIRSNRGDSYWVTISGANHFSLAWPLDESTGRHFLDRPEEGDGAKIRELLASLFVGFVRDVCTNTTSQVRALEGHTLVANFRCR